MYRDKTFRVRDLVPTLEDIAMAARRFGPNLNKVFVADGDALAMPIEQWRPILRALRTAFPALKRVSCYATAANILEKSPTELAELTNLGLTRLYIGPESGDDLTLKRIAKGNTHQDHVDAASCAHDAGMEISVIALLGAGGTERTAEHAHQTAALISSMNPEFFAALTLTVVPGTPLERLVKKGRFVVPAQTQLLRELHTMVTESRPHRAMFRTNHASNYLPLAGYLPRDGARLGIVIQAAIDGTIPLRPEHHRGL